MIETCEFCDSELKSISEGFGKCKHCDVIFNGNYKSISYEHDYFNLEYHAQYGRTYEQDAENIIQKMSNRLNFFLDLKPNLTGKSFLEIGSAAGFFLELAQEQGFKTLGWEISNEMSLIAQRKGLSVEQGDFFILQELWMKSGKSLFDNIAAFYVFEHFSGQKKFWLTINSLMKKGGFLLLTMPSFFGPSFYFHRSQWIKSHPIDHYIDTSPAGMKKIGRRFGFSLIATQAEGIHPGRFPMGKLPILNNCYSKIQQRFSFSDTIFAIFQKFE